MQRRAALALIFGASLCWSLAGVLIKRVDWNPMAIAGVRSAIAALVLLGARPGLRVTRSGAQWAGALVLAFTLVTFVAANRMTTAANAILLQYTFPAWVALFSGWFLKERVRRADWISIVVVLAGMTMFFFDRLSLAHLAGSLTAVVSGFAFAWVVLFTRRMKDGSPFGFLFLGNLVTAVVGLPFAFGGGPDAKGWIALLLLGTVQLGLAYVLFGLGTPHVPALDAALVLLIEPVLNPLWAYLFLGERPGPWAMVGGAVILAAIAARAFKPATVTPHRV